MGRLDGKVALVVGAGSRFGQVVAVALAREGALVAAGCGDDASGSAAVAAVAAQGGQARHVLLDPTDAASSAAAVDAALTAYGRIDVLVTRVASPPRQPRPFAELGDADWDEALRHVLRGAVLPIRSAFPALSRQRGSVVVVSSGAALAGVPNAAAFSAATGALVSLTRALAAEGRAAGVRVNCVCLDASGGTTAADAAPTIVYLASDESRPVSGQVIALGEDRG